MKLLEQLMPSGITRSMGLHPGYETGASRHNAEVSFVVARGDCAVEWMFHSGWFLKETRKHPKMANYNYLPDGLGAISYHSPTPQYDGQTPSSGDGANPCEYTHGTCYGDAGYQDSNTLFDKVVKEPEEVWRYLEERLGQIEARVKEERENERNFS